MSCPNCDWLKTATEASGEKIEKSGIFLSLLTKNYKKDPLCALQLGIAIILGKPLALIVVDGEPVPETLRRLAFAVEECNDPADVKTAAANIMREAERLGI